MASRNDRTSAGCESKTAPLSIVYRRVDELRSDPCNPRRHSRKQIQQIAESIRAFGFNIPCLIDQQMRIISGHGRLAAAKYLGIAHIPTITVGHLTEYQKRALQIADNKLTENSAWDKQLLAEQLYILQGLNLNFSLESTGFKLPEIELLIENSQPVRKKSTYNPEKFLDSEPGVAVTRPGDVWALGRHRIICGSPLKQQSYSTVMNGQHAAVVFTHLSADARAAELLAQIFSQLVEHCNSDALQFVVTDALRITNIAAAAERSGLAVADLCVRIKAAAQPGPLYHHDADFIVVLRKPHSEHSRKPQFDRSNVWREPLARSRRRRPAADAKCELSQGELSLALVADAIVESSAPAGIVLDPFLGGGSTLLAAEETGRICHAIGSDAPQVDRAVRRWQQLTSTSVVHGELGLSFDELREDRYVGSR